MGTNQRTDSDDDEDQEYYRAVLVRESDADEIERYAARLEAKDG